MRPHVQKWGNSLAVRIPSTLAREAGLESGTPVDLRINSDGDLVIRRDRLPHYRLEGLVAGITPENRHAEVDASPPRGREMI